MDLHSIIQVYEVGHELVSPSIMVELKKALD